MDMQTLIIIVLIVVLIMYLMNRNQSQSSNGGSYLPGDERPTYDDPDIEGRGSFGRDHGSSSSPRMTNSPSRRVDSPTVRGRGSFGKDKR